MSSPFRKATVIVCTLIAMSLPNNIKAQGADRKAFFASPQSIPKKYDKPGLYPTGRSLPYGFYSFGGGTENKRGELPDMDQRFYDQNQIAAGHYVNMIGPAYELNQFILDDAARCRTQCIYSVHSPGVEGILVDGVLMGTREMDAMAKEGREPDWEKVEKTVKEIVSKVASSPWIYAWNLAPEELRSWNKTDMKMHYVVSKAVREADPLKRPMMMYLPNHYGARTMKPFFPGLDIVAKGAYVNYAGQKNSRAWVRWTMEQEKEAYPDGVHFVLPEMFQDVKPEERELIPAWVRHDVYCGLANGAKGVLIFSASRRPKFTCRTTYLNTYLEIAKELNDSRQLGDSYLFGEARNDLSLDIIEGPKTVHVKFFDANVDYPSLSFLNIAWTNARYLTIVNSANETVTAVLDNLPYGSDIVMEELTGKCARFVVPEGNVNLTFKPLEVKLLKVSIQQESKKEKKEMWSSFVRRGIADIGITASKPFQWQGRLLRLDYCGWNDDSDHYYANFTGKSYQRIVNAGTGEFVSPPIAIDSQPGAVFEKDGKLTVLYPKKSGGLACISSADLKQWSKPEDITAPDCANPSVCRMDGKWFMAFENKKGTIGIATSNDAKKWTPLADSSLKGAAPCVIAHENRLYMIFAAENQIKIAFSADGAKWQVAKQPFMLPSESDAISLTPFPPALEALTRNSEKKEIIAAAMTMHNDMLSVFYIWKKQSGTAFVNRAQGVLDFQSFEK